MFATGTIFNYLPMVLEWGDSAIKWSSKGATVIFLLPERMMQSQWVLSCAVLGLTSCHDQCSFGDSALEPLLAAV